MITIPQKNIYQQKIQDQNVRCFKLINNKSPLNFVVFSGSHSNLERMYSIFQFLNNFGSVYSLDLPGFGLSKPFNKIDPSLENYAHFIKGYYDSELQNKKVIPVGFSLGFIFHTLLLKYYPDFVSNLDAVVTLGGLTKADKMKMSMLKRNFLWLMARFAATKGFSCLASSLIFSRSYIMKPVVKYIAAKDKLASTKTDKEFEAAKQLELDLWQQCDIRSHYFTISEVLKLDIRMQKIKTPHYFFYADYDQYFDSEEVNEDVKEIYSNSEFFKLNLDVHAPSIISSKEEIASMIPQDGIKILEELANKQNY